MGKGQIGVEQTCVGTAYKEMRSRDHGFVGIINENKVA
jgi:hypothetical protein